MAFAPTFTGFVTTSGRLVMDDRNGFIDHARSFAGKAVELTIRRKRSQRSLDQNAYIHAVPIPLLAEHFGYTIPEMKLVLMGECFGWKEVHGHEIPVKPHTSDMSVEECQYFIDWVIPWAAENHGCVIPLPNEVEVTS